MSLPKFLDWAPQHVSYSTINGYRSCAKRTLLEKVYRVESVPGLAALGGNVVHSATELIDRHILEFGLEALSSEDIIQLDIINNDEGATA